MYPGAVSGANIAWISSTNKQANTVIWPLLKRATKNLWEKNKDAKSEQDKVIRFPGGGAVTVWSAESPDTIRGDGMDGVVFDEAAFAAAGEYLWFDVLRPALLDRRGWAIFISTPNGHNYFWRLFQLAKTRDNWGCWQLPTHDNPYIDAEELKEIEEEARLFGRSVEQEIYADFTKTEGTYWNADVFDGVFDWKDKIPTMNGWPTYVKSWVMSVDTSFGGDFQAIACGAASNDGHFYVRCHLSKLTEVKFIRKICRVIKDEMAGRPKWMPARVWIEEQRFKDDQADEEVGSICRQVREEFKKTYGFDVSGVVKSIPLNQSPFSGKVSDLKDKRIIALDHLFQDRIMRFYDCPDTRRAVGQFVDFELGGSTATRKDDGCDGVARVWENYEDANRYGLI